MWKPVENSPKKWLRKGSKPTKKCNGARYRCSFSIDIVKNLRVKCCDALTELINKRNRDNEKDDKKFMIQNLAPSSREIIAVRRRLYHGKQIKG